MDYSFIINTKHDPAYNLALEETLFEEAERTQTGFVMLWSNDPVVVVGRFQNTAEEVNLAFVRQNGVRVVRRMSGGGAVYHDRGNLNYTVVMPADTAVLDIYSFALPLLGFLHLQGVDAQASGRNDVTIGGRKISGVAQYSRGGVVLHHGTILFDSRLDDVEKALNVKTEKFQSKGFKSVRSRVMNLRPYLHNLCSIGQFRDALASSLIEYYGVRTVRQPTDEEENRARVLASEKYETDDWTWGQSPLFTVKMSRRFPGGTVQLGLVVNEGHVSEAHISGDFFSSGGVEEVERALTGLTYPFVEIRQRLLDGLLERAFLNIDADQLRAFFME